MSKSTERATPANDAASAPEALFPASELPIRAKEDNNGPPRKAAKRKVATTRASSATIIEVDPAEVPLHRLNFRGEEPLNEAHVRSLHESIAEFGQATPIKATRTSKTGPVLAYDGRHRLEAIRRLRANGALIMVKVEIDERSEQEILKDIYNQQVMTKDVGSGERARFLLRRCEEDFDNVQVALARALGVTQSTLSKQLAPAKLDPAIIACMSDVAEIPLNPAAAVVALQGQKLKEVIAAAQAASHNGKASPKVVLNACKGIATDAVSNTTASDIMLDEKVMGSASYGPKSGLRISLVRNAQSTPELIEAVAAVMRRMLPAGGEAAAAQSKSQNQSALGARHR